MGRLQLLGITAILMYSSVVLAGYSTNQKDLERAAELAVERAAEKAAERAVEKALNSGNSSTVTVTVKESYANAKKTAEEQAVPGSESTRPYDPKMYDRQYAYVPPAEGDDKASDSAEAKELGISQESLNSSVEDLGSTETPEAAVAAVESAEAEEPEEPAELSFESARDTSEKSLESAGPSSFESSLDFGADFGSLDMSGDPDFKGDFGLKSKSKTFTSSYSKPKEGFPETKVDVDANEDANIFKMYASDFGGTGWSSTKQKGWVRHRPLWDDTKSRVSRGSKNSKNGKNGGSSYWDIFSEIFEKEIKKKEEPKAKVEPPPMKLFKRMAVENENDGSDQIAVPLATLSVDSKSPSALYHLLKRELKLHVPANKYGRRSAIPMKVYVTIPVNYLPSYAKQKLYETEIVDSKPVASKPSEMMMPPKQLNDEMNAGASSSLRKTFKRSSNSLKPRNVRLIATQYNPRSTPDVPLTRSYRSIVRGPSTNLRLSEPILTPKAT